MNILQYTPLFFLIAIFYSFYHNYFLLTILLLFNFVISLYTHRNERYKYTEIIDYIDYFSILIWFLYNLYLFSKCKNKILKLLIFFCFIILILIQECRIRYKWRTAEREIAHACAHFFGIIGTLLVIRCSL